MNRLKNTIGWAGMLGAALMLSACDLDLTDPNNPNEVDVVTDPQGLMQVGIGLQAEYGNGVVSPIYIDALVTDLLGAIPEAFESYRLVDAGQAVEANLGPSTETWAAMYDVVQVADVLLENVPQVSSLQTGTASGLLALANLFKAMAFGHLLQTYERIPLDVGLDNLNAEFATRAEGLQEVLRLLNEARSQIQTTPPSSEFNTIVLAPGFNLSNTIDAMIARYSLITGDLSGALTAAQRVSPTVLSEMRFSTSDPNSLWNMWLGSGNSVRLLPEDRFRTQAQSGDLRVEYWVTPAATVGSSVPLDAHDRYSARDVSFPVYLPDEMKLIQAEVYARQNNLPQALILLNQVRTQCSSAINEPVACLPALTLLDVPTQQAMLDAIFYERQYELYLQGLHWSDARRFGRPLKYEFMMVSAAECLRNSNAPPEVCQATTEPN